jgi:hypothetical protein
MSPSYNQRGLTMLTHVGWRAQVLCGKLQILKIECSNCPYSMPYWAMGTPFTPSQRDNAGTLVVSTPSVDRLNRLYLAGYLVRP